MRRSGSGSSHSSLSDSWHHNHGRGTSSNLLAIGVLPASKWRFLRHLSLADNSMTSIPLTSLAPLSNTLFSLDLSSNLFSQVPDSLATLTALRALNLSHCMIDSLHSLTRNPLPAITALNLRANRLQSLAGVEKLFPLERLDLRDNRLTDPMELARLTGIPDLREIWIEGNPFARTHKDYRITIFNLFRKTPGYTSDIIIDGSGPSYTERRLLLDRTPIPDSVPVVKPQAPVVPTVNVSKPSIIYTTKEPTVLRKERPVPKAIMSETNTSSTRRRKTPKRRIVDLATNDGHPNPAPVDVSIPNLPNAPAFPDGNYRISHEPEPALLPPAVLSSNSSDNFVSSPETPRIDTSVVNGLSHVYPALSVQKDWPESQDWDASGEIYRQKIEALRDKVGNGYLTVLGEESWGPKGPPEYSSPDVTSSTAHRAAHNPHHIPPAQAIHSGRTLG